MKKRSKYKPGRYSARYGIDLFNARMAANDRSAIDRDRVLNLVLRARESFYAARSGRVGIADMQDIAVAISISHLLSQIGYGGDAEKTAIARASDEVLAALHAGPKDGFFCVSESCQAAVAELLEINEAQLEVCTRADFLAVLAERMRQIELENTERIAA